MKPNPVVWFEIYVQDMNRARKFYEDVFQCQLEDMAAPGADSATPNDSAMLSFPMSMDATGTGGMLVQAKDAPPGPGGTTVYFTCEDCEVEQNRAVKAGGRIHQAKFSIGQYGYCALVQDTEGNIIGLHSMQ